MFNVCIYEGCSESSCNLFISFLFVGLCIWILACVYLHAFMKQYKKDSWIKWLSRDIHVTLATWKHDPEHAIFLINWNERSFNISWFFDCKLREQTTRKRMLDTQHGDVINWKNKDRTCICIRKKIRAFWSHLLEMHFEKNDVNRRHWTAVAVKIWVAHIKSPTWYV